MVKSRKNSYRKIKKKSNRKLIKNKKGGALNGLVYAGPNNVDANNVEANNVEANNLEANNVEANNLEAKPTEVDPIALRAQQNNLEQINSINDLRIYLNEQYKGGGLNDVSLDSTLKDKIKVVNENLNSQESSAKSSDTGIVSAFSNLVKSFLPK